MKRASLKIIFPIVSFLLLAPWPVAYAYADNSGNSAPDFVQVTPATTEAAPSINTCSGTISSVTPGDLFCINAAGSNADMEATLYLTNSDELVHYYRYAIMKVGVYVQDSEGGWQKATNSFGIEVPETYISMIDSQVVLHLPGLANYKITLDSGSIYSLESKDGQTGSIQPQFYLDIDQG
jgi:hypothetical protein